MSSDREFDWLGVGQHDGRPVINDGRLVLHVGRHFCDQSGFLWKYQSLKPFLRPRLNVLPIIDHESNWKKTVIRSLGGHAFKSSTCKSSICNDYDNPKPESPDCMVKTTALTG